jgi:hypothetical protein
MHGCGAHSKWRWGPPETAAFTRGITSVAARTPLSMNPYKTAEVSVPAQ